jgi:hypothetical protein
MAEREWQNRDRHVHDRGRPRENPPRASADAWSAGSARPSGNRGADYGWRDGVVI